MQTGAITPYIDVAQLVLYAFWIFFAGLIVYLLRENKREGYPLESDRSQRAPRVPVQGFPRVPDAKTYLLRDGRVVKAPRVEAPDGPLRAHPIGPWPGAPLQPDGDPMRAEVGPGSYARRPDIVDTTVDGAPRLVPLRGALFAGVPVLRQPDTVTMLEEEKIMAYYGAGTLYATAQRQEPLL